MRESRGRRSRVARGSRRARVGVCGLVARPGASRRGQWSRPAHLDARPRRAFERARGVNMEVEYCPQCTCPPEYCEYVSCARGAAEKLEKVALDGDADTSTAREGEGGDDTPAVEAAEKPKSSKSKSKAKAKEEVITRLSRNRRKMITNVVGLEKFDVDLKDASKMFGKKFACGCSVTKGATGKDELDLQGDYSEQLGELIVSKYDITEEELRYVDKSKF